MKLKQTLKVALTIVMTVGIAVPGWTESPKFKMTTDFPPGIAMPETVETRLGVLNFFDGFPDKPTVERLYDNLIP
jgi:hypothetical protein